MEQVSITGIDLAKWSFQLHGARADGSVAYRGHHILRRRFSFAHEYAHILLDRRHGSRSQVVIRW